MRSFSKVIFVSTSGTCRSIWAEILLDKYKMNKQLIVESRGHIVLFEEPANPKAVAIAKSKGFDIENKVSKPLVKEDFGEDNLILVMTESMKKKIYDDYENAVNVYSLKEFIGAENEIEPAYGGELVEYGEKFEQMEKQIVQLSKQLNSEI